MSFIKYNPNPQGKDTGDCVVRALAIAEGLTWDEAFKGVTDQAFREKDMPSMNPVWANFLLTQNGGEILSSRAIVTPTVVDAYFNVTATAYVTVPRGCCFDIAVENTSTIPINVQNANMVVTREA